MVERGRVRHGGTRPPRWRCGDPQCPARRWQRVSAVGEYDVVDEALHDLERHWQEQHQEHERREDEWSKR